LILDREDYAWLLKTRYREARVNVGGEGVRSFAEAVVSAEASFVTAELAGPTLGEGHVEPLAAFEAVKKACAAVAAAHARGRVHGLITVHDIELSGAVTGFGLAEIARRLEGERYEEHVRSAPDDVAPE